MGNKKILKLTLEEYGYQLDKLIYPVDGLLMAISEAMDRARLDQCDKIVKKIEQRTNRIGAFYANEEKTYDLIKKL
jgi:hypothetical protein